MATTPQLPDINISEGIDNAVYPTRTFYVDKATGRINRITDGQEAMCQAVDIILNTERYAWKIYTPNFGSELNGLIGKSRAFVMNAIPRRIRDALLMDDRILSAENFLFGGEYEILTVSFLVNTIYGQISSSVAVELA